jgi:predicted nucleotidyltransferase
MPEIIIQPRIAEMLKDLESVLTRHNVDFYMVGAAARDIHLSTSDKHRSKRATNDIDLGILVNSDEEFQTIREELIATGKFTPTREVIRLLHNQSLEVDLMPFGGIENEKREVKISQPKLFVMDVPGFMEAYMDTITYELDGFHLNVSSVEGIILLKLIAYDDRPDRTKDLDDIDYFIEVYFDLFFEDIYVNYMGVMEIYDTTANDYLSMVSARVIGRKLKVLLDHSPELFERVCQILSRKAELNWQAMLDGMGD